MEMRNAEINDFHTIMSWIQDDYECRNWAGRNVRFPLNIDNL